MDSRFNKYLMLSGAVTPIVFAISLILLGYLFPGYDHVRDYISELGAVDSPIRNTANFFAFFPMGLFLILFSIGLYRVIGSRGIFAKIGSVLLIFSGILLTSVGFFPCDSGCYNITQIGLMHKFTGLGALYLGGIALLFFAVHAFRGRTFPKKWSVSFFSVAVVAGTLGYTAPQLEDTVYGGLVQRLAIFIPLIFMGSIAYYLYKKIKLNKKGKKGKLFKNIH